MARNRYVKLLLKDIVVASRPADLTGSLVVGHHRGAEGSWLLVERPEAAKRTRAAKKAKAAVQPATAPAAV